jgi:predicted permease
MTTLWRRIERVIRRSSSEVDLDTEIEFYLHERTKALRRSGMSDDEARRTARLEFGSVQKVKDDCRDTRRLRVVEIFLHDVRYAVWMLWRNRGFAASAIATLTVGIAASTGLFAVLDVLVLHPLPYADADRLARVQLVSSSGRPRQAPVTTAEFLALRRAPTLDAVYATDAFTKNLEGGEFPESVSAAFYSGNALSVLGVRTVIGRVFTEADAPIGVPPQRVALLSEPFWHRHFGGDPAVLGQTLRLTGEPFTVIGVVPSEAVADITDIILPLAMTFDPKERWPVTVRVKADASLTAAEAELQQLYQRFADTRPIDFPRGFRVHVSRLLDEERGSTYVPIVIVLFAAAALLLLIGCVNVTILLLARGRHRVHELALRQALGATRGRLVSLLLCETLLITFAATALGVLLLTRVLPLLVAAAPAIGANRAGRITVGPAALLFATATTVLTTVVAGLWPALVVSRPRSSAMRDASVVRTATGRAGGEVGVVAVQVGLAVVLLAGTGAAIRSLLELYRANLGYDPTHVTIAQLNLPEGRYTAWLDRVRFYERLRAEVAQTSSVESSTVCLVPTTTPPQISGPTPIEAEGLPGDRDVREGGIASDYFSTLRIPLVRGRMWSASDDARGEGVAVINETLARQLWPNDNPIGKRIRNMAIAGRLPVWQLRAPGRDGWFSIIGVVRDTPNQGVREPVAGAMYYPYTAALSDVAVLIVRTKGDPSVAERDLRAAVSRADPGLPIMRFISPAQFTGVRQEQFLTVLLVAFAGVALLLASFGLFSVSYYAVARRTREFGIRIALGATGRDVLRSAFQSTVLAVFAGLAVGVVLSVGLSSVIAHWSIRNVDNPVVLAVAVSTLLLSTGLATLIPARRATAINPTIALKVE